MVDFSPTSVIVVGAEGVSRDISCVEAERSLKSPYFVKQKGCLSLRSMEVDEGLVARGNFLQRRLKRAYEPGSGAAVQDSLDLIERFRGLLFLPSRPIGLLWVRLFEHAGQGRFGFAGEGREVFFSTAGGGKCSVMLKWLVSSWAEYRTAQ